MRRAAIIRFDRRSERLDCRTVAPPRVRPIPNREPRLPRPRTLSQALTRGERGRSDIRWEMQRTVRLRFAGGKMGKFRKVKRADGLLESLARCKGESGLRVCVPPLRQVNKSRLAHRPRLDRHSRDDATDAREHQRNEI